ncbi:MAG: septal ring lytic transglycosylase RlpA family protein [Gammaproteobacteria bacterium]
MRPRSTRPLPALLLATVVFLGGCAGGGHDGPDGPPRRGIDPSDVRDAVPKWEPRSPYGNGPVYEVWGEKYRVMDSAAGYRERGLASWYGSKFHGRRTSSGEPYDLYKPTAAHRTLPLPTYAEVTNLDNGRKVVVKVNDRGPFHSERIIDLSYGAAVRLGMVDQGTARVEVRAITFGDDGPDTRLAEDTYLQAGAFGRKSSARDLENSLRRNGVKPTTVWKSRGLYKVLVGPFDRLGPMNDTARRIVELGYENPIKITR